MPHVSVLQPRGIERHDGVGSFRLLDRGGRKRHELHLGRARVAVLKGVIYAIEKVFKHFII